MKLGLIFICLSILGCAASPESPKEEKEYVNDYQPSYSGGGGYYNPCGRVYVLEIKTDAGTFRKEVPIYCNPNADEYYGDPPDYHTNPWDTQILPPQYQPDERVPNAR